MTVPSAGYTTRLGVDTRYEYRWAIYNRDATSLWLTLYVRLMPAADVDGSVFHGTVAYGTDLSHQKTTETRIVANGLSANKWTDWLIVFDNSIAFSLDENMLYVLPEVGLGDYSFDGSDGLLDDGIDVGSYPRPDDVSTIDVTPTRIDVAQQNEQSVKVTWPYSTGAAGYRVYLNTACNLTGAKVAVDRTTTASATFNPKRVMVGGIDWSQTEIRAGYSAYVGVEAFDNTNISASNITWSEEIVYGERLAKAPTNAFVVGQVGEKNEIAYVGENNVKLYYSGDLDGSYEVVRYVLRRQDGIEFAWNKDDVKADLVGKYVVLNLSSWAKPNKTVKFELRAYDSMGRPVYVENETWFKFSILFYGGLIGVYGKLENNGSEYDYSRQAGSEKWRIGLCWVYDGSKWRRAKSVYVYSADQWETL